MGLFRADAAVAKQVSVNPTLLTTTPMIGIIDTIYRPAIQIIEPTSIPKRLGSVRKFSRKLSSLIITPE
jgi:hypothetical protein